MADFVSTPAPIRDSGNTLEEKLRRAESLVIFNKLITTTIDVPEIYRRSSRLMSQELGCSRCLVSIVDTVQDMLVVEMEFVQTAESDGKHRIQPYRFDPDEYPRFKHVLETQEVVRQTAVDDDLNEKERAYFAEHNDEHGLLLPILQDGRSRGIIHLYRATDAPPFSETCQDIAQTMVTQLGFTLRNALFASEARARAAQLSTVNRVNSLLAMASSLKEVMQGARREIFALVEATGMSIILLERDVEMFRWIYSYEHGSELDLSDIPLLPVTQGFSSQVYQKQEIVVFNKEIDTKRTEFRSITVGALPNIWAGFPLIVANNLIGILAVENSEDSYAFSEYDIQLLETISRPIAVAINNLIQFEQVQDALVTQSTQRLLLQTASEVAAAASSIRDVDELMEQAVNLMKERFTLYYVGLFLVDEKREYAVLRAGTGKTGRMQLKSNHRLPIGGRSLIGGVIKDGQPRIVQDVSLSDEWRANPLLPNTRSEMSLPLHIGEQTIGGLSVQSAEINAFDPILISTLQTMSDQLAVAIENTQLLQTAQRYSNQLNVAAEVSRAATTILDRERLITEVVELIRSRFDLYYVGLFLLNEEETQAILHSGTGEAGRIQLKRGHFLALDGQSMISQAVNQNEPQVAQDVTTAVNFKPNPMLPSTRSEAALPLRARGRTIGALTVQSSQLDWFTDEGIRVLQSLTDQLAISIDNAGLFVQTEATLRETSILYEASRQLSEAPDQDSTYQALVDFARTTELCDVVHIVRQADEDEDEDAANHIITAKLWSRPGLIFNPPDRYHVDQIAPFNQPSDNTRKIIIFPDTKREPLLQGEIRRLMLLFDISTTAMLPILIENEWLGTIILHRVGENIRPFTEDELQALRTLTDQSTTILANQRLFAEIQSANEKLRQLDQLKTQFLANMSHELRTPLNSIIGFSRVILKGIDGPITPEQEEDLNSIHNNGQHLLMLINEILDMAKIEAGKMMLSFEPVDLAETSYSAITAIRTMVDEKGLTLRADIADNLPPIEADPVRLKQILINLLSNAAKYTDKGYVNLRIHLDGAEHVQISVQDTGIGIATEDHQTLFRPFEQIDNSSTRAVGGTGLGLPLTRWMVTMHHGEIWFDSELGAGTTFYVKLPIFQPGEAVEHDVMSFLNATD